MLDIGARDTGLMILLMLTLTQLEHQLLCSTFVESGLALLKAQNLLLEN
jgi:hypothetical protein